MTLVHCENRESFFAQIESEIHERLDLDSARRLSAFARIFYNSFPLEELDARRLRDVYASTYFFWAGLQKRGGPEPRVQVFNPSLEEHGWTSEHTVVAVTMRDMPFLLDSLRLALDRRGIPISMLHSVVLEVARDAQLKFVACSTPGTDPGDPSDSPSPREALVYLEIGRHSTRDDLASIARELGSVISDVSLAVDDFDAMRSRLGRILEACTTIAAWISPSH